MISGDMEAAREGLKEILLSSPDQTVRRAAFEVQARILSQECRWTELLEMEKNAPPEQDESVWTLFRAFSLLPAESVHIPATPQSFPLSISLSGSPIVDVRVNGHLKKFWIDTGANMSVISSDTAKECGVGYLGGTEAHAGAVAGEVAAAPAVIHKLEIGEITFDNQPAIIIKKEDMELKLLGFIPVMKIDGIIGWPVLMRMKISIDIPAGTITFEKSAVNPLKTRNLFSPGYPVIQARSAFGDDLYLGLDTGARVSGIKDALLAKTGKSDATTKSTTRYGIGGGKKFEVKRLKNLSLSIGSTFLHFENIETGNTGDVVIAPFILLDGVLGIDTAKTALMIIDYPNGFFGLEKSAR